MATVVSHRISILLMLIPTAVLWALPLLWLSRLRRLHFKSQAKADVSASYRHPDEMLRLENVTFRRAKGESSMCRIVACASRSTPGIDTFFKYYSQSTFSVTVVQFSRVMTGRKSVRPNWCCVPAVIDELRRYPNARVLFLDIDTKVDPAEWCALPRAPIVMNSLYREKALKLKDYTLFGTHVQSNAFITDSGNNGMSAMIRWERNFYVGTFQDQGAIHTHERGLCGIPGWISCYSNPIQQRCHCSSIRRKADKQRCIDKLFSGNHLKCAPFSKPLMWKGTDPIP